MFAVNLKKAREKKGLSQEYVAKKLGISQPAYSYFENGLKIPSLNMVKAIADLFEVTIDELVK